MQHAAWSQCSQQGSSPRDPSGMHSLFKVWAAGWSMKSYWGAHSRAYGMWPTTGERHGELLTAEVGVGVRGQSGCWCGCTLSLHCSPLQDGVVSVPRVLVAIAGALCPGDPASQPPRLLRHLIVPHPQTHTHTTHSPLTPLLTLSPSLQSCQPPCWAKIYLLYDNY